MSIKKDAELLLVLAGQIQVVKDTEPLTTKEDVHRLRLIAEMAESIGIKAKKKLESEPWKKFTCTEQRR